MDDRKLGIGSIAEAGQPVNYAYASSSSGSHHLNAVEHSSKRPVPSLSLGLEAESQPTPKRRRQGYNLEEAYDFLEDATKSTTFNLTTYFDDFRSTGQMHELLRYSAGKPGHTLILVSENMRGTGLSLDLTSTDDETALELAIHADLFSNVRPLLEFGASIGTRNNAGKQPLHIAAEYLPSDSVLRALLDAHADVLAKDNDGKRPLDLLVDQMYDMSIRTLMSNSWDLHRIFDLVTLFLDKGAGASSLDD
jgi:hypothetical protein